MWSTPLLEVVTALAQATVGGADGASVSLARHGRIGTVAATDETVAQMDRDQYATGQGPCLAAAGEGHLFHVESVDEEWRWPDFVPRARTGGIGSILSTPLRATADQSVGALSAAPAQSTANWTRPRRPSSRRLASSR